MKTSYTITFVALFCCIVIMAKTPKADRLFERWEYFKAAKLYEEETAKNPSADVYFKLGECYRKMGCYKKEEQAAYDKVNAAGTYSNPEFYLNYGQVLKSNGIYDQAKVAFDKYAALVPSDPRGKFFSASIDIAKADHQWDEPIRMKDVDSLNSKSAELCPAFYKDGIVFSSTRHTPSHDKIDPWTGGYYLDLYYAQKGKNDTSFAKAVPFGGHNLDEKYHDGLACFSKNYDTVYISRVEKSLKGEQKKTLQVETNKIFISTMKDDKWSKAMPFAFNSDSFSVANPFLTPDGSRIYFVSDMPGGYGETDIYYSNRQGATWSKPINMGSNVNTFGREKYPSVDADGNFYFSSDGYQGFGGADICVALNNNGVLQKAKPLKYPFNSNADDYGILFVKNGKTGYISSNRVEGGQGDDDIFYFDLLQDNVDKDLVVSAYTIGYKRKQAIEAVAVVDSIEEKPQFLTEPLVKNVLSPGDLRIYFDFDKSDIRPDAIAYLDSVLSYMKKSPSVRLIIAGHCDSRGTPEYNMVLSNKRDKAVVQYLEARNIKRKRIVAKGYGSSRLVNSCVPGVECTESEHQLNRRVEFRFQGVIPKDLVVQEVAESK